MECETSKWIGSSFNDSILFEVKLECNREVISFLLLLHMMYSKYATQYKLGSWRLFLFDRRIYFKLTLMLETFAMITSSTLVADNDFQLIYNPCHKKNKLNPDSNSVKSFL